MLVFSVDPKILKSSENKKKRQIEVYLKPSF